MGDIHGYPSFLLFHGENHDQLSIQGATPVPEVLGCWWWQCGSPGGHVDSWTVLGFFVFFLSESKTGGGQPDMDLELGDASSSEQARGVIESC